MKSGHCSTTAPPHTVDVVFTGICLGDDRMAMFCEANTREALGTEALRSAEALLHTPVMITLFTADGEPLYRNPTARSCARNADETLDEHFVNSATKHLIDRATEDEINIVAPVHSTQGECWHDISARRCLDAVSGEHAWLISEVDVSRLRPRKSARSSLPSTTYCPVCPIATMYPSLSRIESINF